MVTEEMLVVKWWLRGEGDFLIGEQWIGDLRMVAG